MVACVDGVAVCVGRGDKGEVVDGHASQCLQLLNAGEYAVEVGSCTSHLAINILLVGELVLRRCSGREQAVNSLEDVEECTTDNRVGGILSGLLVEGQLVLLAGEGSEDTTTLHWVVRVLGGCGVEGQIVLLGTNQLHKHLVCGKRVELLDEHSRDARLDSGPLCGGEAAVVQIVLEHPALTVHPLVTTVDGVTLCILADDIGIVVGVGGHLVKFALRIEGTLEVSRSRLDGRVDKLLVGELVLRAGSSRNL